NGFTFSTTSTPAVPAAYPARLSLLFHDEVSLPMVRLLPATIRAAAAFHQANRVLQACVARGPDGLEVIQCAKNVIMPARWEGEAGERRLDHFARPVRAKEAVYKQELAAATLRGAHRRELLAAVQFIEAHALERADGRVHGGVCGALVAPAIPASIGH